MGLGMGEGGKRLSFLDQIIYVLIITNETTLYDRIKETTKQTNSTPPLTTSLQLSKLPSHYFYLISPQLLAPSSPS